MITTDVLRFSEHDFAIFCYSASNVEIIYAGHAHNRWSDGEIAPARTAADDQRYTNGKFGTYRTFASIVHAEWNALDGARLSTDVDLDEVFPDHVVLHEADPASIFQPKPIIGPYPIIIVEINDHILSIYMDVTIQTLAAESSAIRYERTRYRTLAHTRTL